MVLDRLSESRKGKIGVHSSKGLPLEVWEVNHGCGKAYTWAWAAWQRVMHRRMKIGWLHYTASVWVVHLAKTWRKWTLVWTWLLWDHSRRITLCLYHPLHWPFRMPCSSTSVILPCVFLSKAILRHHFAISHQWAALYIVLHLPSTSTYLPWRPLYEVIWDTIALSLERRLTSQACRWLVHSII